MKYQGLNRVYRIRDAVFGADQELDYIAPSEEAALKCHRDSVGVKPSKRKLKIEELSPEKHVRVTFVDCAQAIAAITGAENADLIRQSIRGVPFADESIVIGRAADYWANVSRSATVRLLTARES